MLIPVTGIPAGGVDINDAVIIANAPPGYFIPGTLKFLAADVNEDQIVNIFDAVIIANSLPSQELQEWTAPPWIFQNPLISVSDVDVIQDIQGICSGDVNTDRFNPPR